MKSSKGIAREVNKREKMVVPQGRPNSMVYARAIVREGPEFAENLRKRMSRRTFRRVMNYVRHLEAEAREVEQVEKHAGWSTTP